MLLGQSGDSTTQRKYIVPLLTPPSTKSGDAGQPQLYCYAVKPQSFDAELSQYMNPN